MLFAIFVALSIGLWGCASTSQIQPLEEKVSRIEKEAAEAMKKAEAAEAEAERCREG